MAVILSRPQCVKHYHLQLDMSPLTHRLYFYQTRSVWSMDQGSNKNHSPINNFTPTVTKFCVMWEGQALPHDTKFCNCSGKIVDSRTFPNWSLIHESSWSGLIKAEPGHCGNMGSSRGHYLRIRFAFSCLTDEPLAPLVTTNRIMNVYGFQVVIMLLMYAVHLCLYSLGNKINNITTLLCHKYCALIIT